MFAHFQFNKLLIVYSGSTISYMQKGNNYVLKPEGFTCKWLREQMPKIRMIGKSLSVAYTLEE